MVFLSYCVVTKICIFAMNNNDHLCSNNADINRNSAIDRTILRQSIPIAPNLTHTINMEQQNFDLSSGSNQRESVPLPHQHPARNNTRTWRMNLNDVLSFSSVSSAEALRFLIPSQGTFRYVPLNRIEPIDPGHPTNRLSNNSGDEIGSRSTSRNNSMREEIINQTINNETAELQLHDNLNLQGEPTEDTSEEIVPVENRETTGNNNRDTLQDEDDTNFISELIVKILSHFVRYLPFICIVFIKFIHDHLVGILDLLLLHSVMYHINKALKAQVAKFSQKSYGVLARDFCIVGFVVVYRVILSKSKPDIFGLLISPPSIESISDGGLPQSTDAVTDADNKSELMGYIFPTTKSTSLSLGLLLYYVAINDLILKLITILVKIFITSIPKFKHKPRARTFVLVELLSQFVRALAPVRQWLFFLFKSYTGLEIISGILFSSFYIGAKGFEFVERGKLLKKALLNFLRNMDYVRKPTNEELDVAGLLCPICHDSFNTPVVLECGHIFCDDCVGTWLKREQTCPMCRAKITDDPTWQDGSTTFFYQLY